MAIEFEKDMDIFLNTDEFAQPVTYQGREIPAVFDDEFEQRAFGGTVNIETTLRQIFCKTEDVPHIKRDEIIIIDQVRFSVVGIHPDGTGATTLILQRT